MNVITSPTIIITSLIVGWIVWLKTKRSYRALIETKDERIRLKDELLMIAGVPQILQIDIQSHKLTIPYAQALSALIKDETKQILIALKNTKNPVPISSRLEYNLKLGSKYINGVFDSLEIIQEQLKKTHLLECDTNMMRLTELGIEFVDWLVKDGQKASCFQSKLLDSWGSLPADPKGTSVMIHASPLEINTKDV